MKYTVLLKKYGLTSNHKGSFGPDVGHDRELLEMFGIILHY